jgi:hypothetical protein
MQIARVVLQLDDPGEQDGDDKRIENQRYAYQ